MWVEPPPSKGMQMSQHAHRRTDQEGRGGQRGYAVVCAECGTRDEDFAYECRECAGTVVVEPASPGPAAQPGGTGLWRWPNLLPRTGAAVTLGEGNTPLVDVTGLTSAPDGARVLAKLESQNPTLSFKDRAMALGASFAVDRGLKGLVVASTGNAAVSASAYAAAAGLRCRVMVGTASNATVKLAMCREYGAQVEEVEGDYSAASARARAAESDGWLNVSTTYRNPLLAEAYRPVALELLLDLGETPAAVVVPVGAGPLLRGIERGFDDARTTHGTTAAPAMVGVQATGVAPLARAWRSGDWEASLSQAGNWQSTVATAIADPLRGYEREGLLTLAAAQRTGGEVAAVTDEDLLGAQRTLAAAGLWVEPSAAAPLAFLQQQRPGWWTAHAGPVVLVLTGHGIKG